MARPLKHWFLVSCRTLIHIRDKRHKMYPLIYSRDTCVKILYKEWQCEYVVMS